MFIYSITNSKNNKRYIGQTSTELSKRMSVHFDKLRNGVHHNSHLQSSFNKYGEDVFTVEILAEASSIDELNTLEIEFIKKFNTLNSQFGYNRRSGGENYILTDAAKQNMSNAHKGKKLTKEHKQKIAIASTGKTRTTASKKKMSQSRRRYSKFSEEDAIKIKEIYNNGGISQKKLADMYGCRQSAIWYIIHTPIWSEVCDS